jgi:hypothetical protein
MATSGPPGLAHTQCHVGRLRFLPMIGPIAGGALLLPLDNARSTHLQRVAGPSELALRAAAHICTTLLPADKL